MKKENFHKTIFSAICLCMISLGITSCLSNSNANVESDNEGSILPEYSISNNCLDSITSLVFKENKAKILENETTVVLQLNVLENDTIDFVFSFHENEDDIRTKLIALNNKRIVGYLQKDSKDILILTNIDYFRDLEVLKEFISAGNESKRFKYLYYAPTPIDLESMYEPLFWHFKYKNGIVSQPSIHK